MRYSAFDGFPRLLNGKADAQVICIDPTLVKHGNVTMLTELTPNLGDERSQAAAV